MAAILAVARVISVSLESNLVATEELITETEGILISETFTLPNEPVEVIEPLTLPVVVIESI